MTGQTGNTVALIRRSSDSKPDVQWIAVARYDRVMKHRMFRKGGNSGDRDHVHTGADRRRSRGRR